MLHLKVTFSETIRKLTKFQYSLHSWMIFSEIPNFFKSFIKTQKNFLSKKINAL